MRILIVAHYFPPLQTVGAFRPLSWARYWSAAGHSISVLTTAKGSLYGVRNLAAMPDDRYEVTEVPYAIGGGDGVTPAESDWQQPPSIQQPGAIAALLIRVNRVTRRRLIGPLFDPRGRWVRPALDEALRQHRDAPFDVVVSTFGPPATHTIAARFKRATGVPWIADYRDLWSDHVYPGRWPFVALSRGIEQRTVASANLLTTTSDEWADCLRRRFSLPVETVENGYDAAAFAEAPELPPRTDGKLQLLYTGTLYGHDRNPKPLFIAINRIKHVEPDLGSRLEVRLIGDLEGINRTVAQYHLDDIVHLEPPQALPMVLAMQQRADVLLFIDWARDTRGWLTAKLFEYMHAGTPILAIGGSKELSASRLVEEMGCGIALGSDIDAIERTLRDLLEGRQLPYEPDRERLAGLTREALASRMLTLVEGVSRG